MIIEKKQRDIKSFHFNWRFFSSAREGLKYILNLKNIKDKKILIPAYIGYSCREGSGVFDPIRQTKKDYIFYGMDENLHINTIDLIEKIRKNPDSILLLIHYFGFKDRNLELIKNYACKYNMLIIEDFAHAFLSFWLNPIIDFDYAIFSLHKLFPINSGGMILGRQFHCPDSKYSSIYDLFNYDMRSIIDKRITNYKFILKKLEKVNGKYKIKILRRKLGSVVPQTFPILLPDRKIRDYLYFKLNKEGYGVISLYHSLIKEVPSLFVSEHRLSERILNLPVHQDAEGKDLGNMLKTMLRFIRCFKYSG